MNVRVNVETDTWVTEEPEDSDEPYSYRGATDGRVTDVSVYVTEDAARESWYSDPVIEIDAEVGDTVYVVVVDYSTGDTFGRDGGYYQVLDVFTSDEDAVKLRQLAEDYDNGGYRVYSNELAYKGKKYYASWIGYFECTNEIAIWECTVRDERFRYGRKR